MSLSNWDLIKVAAYLFRDRVPFDYSHINIIKTKDPNNYCFRFFSNSFGSVYGESAMTQDFHADKAFAHHIWNQIRNLDPVDVMTGKIKRAPDLFIPAADSQLTDKERK